MNLKVLKNNLSLYFIMENYKYSQDWFLGSEIRKYITSVVDGSKEQHILVRGHTEAKSYTIKPIILYIICICLSVLNYLFR
jgi:hypothetical protein